MSTLFISHSSADKAAASELAGWLDRQGHRSIFLDFDPEHGIPPGRDWEEELYRQLRTCQAFIALCSDAAMASCWCLAELSHARALGKPILPVCIAPCTLRPQLAELQIIDLVKEPALGYERLRGALTGVFDWDRRRPPYPGMMAFEEADAAIFFGRDTEIQQALDRLQQVRHFGGPRLQLFLGASGSGKSSLVRAGILPRLRALPDAWAPIGPVRPRDRPLEALLAQLVGGLTAAGVAVEEARALVSGAEACDLLGEVQQALRRRPGRANATLVLVIDQLEEVLLPSVQAERLMRILGPALRAPDPPVLVIATLRSDFLGSLQAHPDWRDFRPEMVTVAPLSVEGFSAVIEGPAELAGLELETGLVRAMVADTATQDALPLLAFTLRELWEMGGADGRLTLAEYRGLGGLEGAVAKAAQAVFDAVAPSRAQKQVLRAALFALVRLDEEGRYTRQVVGWEDLPAASHSLLEPFVQARLLISASHDGKRTLEVAHESLFRVWKTLSDWLKENREGLRIHTGLRRAAREWQSGGRPAELLNHRGSRLEAALLLAHSGPVPLGDTERAYLQACGWRERKRRLWIAAVWSTLVAAVIGLSWLAWSLHQQERITRQGLAELHWTSGVGARDREGQLLKASHHFVHAAELALEPARAASAYWAALRAGHGPDLVAAADLGPTLQSAALDAAGEAVWLWGGDGASRVWRWEEGSAPAFLAPGSRSVQRFSRDGRPLVRWIAFRDDDGRLEIHDRHGGAAGVTIPAGAERLWIGGDDEGTAVSVHDQAVRVWDLASGEARGGWAQAGGVAGVAIAPEGPRLLLWTPAGEAWLRDADGLRRLASSDAGIVGGALGREADEVAVWGRDGRLWLPERPGFSPSPEAGGVCSPVAIGARFLDVLDDGAPGQGRRLLVWNHGPCGVARLWDLEAQGAIGAVMRHDEEMAPPMVQGRRLLTWSQGSGPARLWDSETGAALARLEAVTGARFAAGDRLLTWHGREARLWSSHSGEPLGLPLRHAATIGEVMASEDGQRLLSWAVDGSLRLWQAPPAPTAVTLRLPAPVLDAVLVEGTEAGEASLRAIALGGQLHVGPPPPGEAPAAREPLDPDAVFAAFAPGGERLLTADVNGEVRLWSWEAGRFQRLAAPGGTTGRDPVTGVVWSANADRLLFWGAQGCTAWLWRLGSALAVPVAHGDEAADATCRLRGVALADDGTGRGLTWGEDRRLRLWDFQASEPVPLETVAEGMLVRTAALDGERLLVASDERGVSLHRLNHPDAERRLIHLAIRGAGWHAGSGRVLSWGGGSVRIWADEGETPLASLVPGGEIVEAAFTPGGERVVSWQTGGRVQLWDALGGHPLTPALQGPGSVATVFDSDIGAAGIRLLIAVDDRITLWQLPAFTAPPPRPALRQEVRTGTRLTIPGEVEVLPATAWQARFREFRELAGARE
ncbi:TIR domain-containing protein [Halomonas sp. BM-2019]|uniref:nSTAND1 domain-containing NTPase n=1 Tax=Halomonas sp. BM-2019 TaxID=2811227 RepID=UPI001B3C2E6E|nr:MAG: TIR domain-containing protein [Halomonas sp. BM-2019]